MKIPDRVIRWVFKPAVFLASLGPFAWLVWAALTGNLSANPLSDLTNETGVWTLRFICITLAITPLRKLTGWNAAIRFRRMAGLFAFFYGTLHFLIYVIADRFAGLDFPDGMLAWRTARNLVASVGEDIYKRPFITVGFTAWMIDAAAGGHVDGRHDPAARRPAVEPAAPAHLSSTAMLGVLHYWWLVKADVSRPLTYGAVVAHPARRANSLGAPAERIARAGGCAQRARPLTCRSNDAPSA